jgi:hypothetical protein
MRSRGLGLPSSRRQIPEEETEKMLILVLIVAAWVVVKISGVSMLVEPQRRLSKTQFHHPPSIAPSIDPPTTTPLPTSIDPPIASSMLPTARSTAQRAQLAFRGTPATSPLATAKRSGTDHLQHARRPPSPRSAPCPAPRPRRPRAPTTAPTSRPSPPTRRRWRASAAPRCPCRARRAPRAPSNTPCTGPHPQSRSAQAGKSDLLAGRRSTRWPTGRARARSGP